MKAGRDVKGPIKALEYKEDRSVRWEAVDALGEIGEPAVEPHIQAVKDESSWVREAAKDSLGRIKEEKV